ncbi:hypothetical protein AArcSl_1627 [Halalkaliarchaeum desulfuricum]|uniref:Uncharacterized protein n=1 Tax=Halalkaliarchaeum desulfuricum TaxID=2055893 RepID=A0A343TJI4_9EURY|nr:hypothetical protein [Halalkaliarchaeum desulfuricum]AUX09256.1 hypothetical protein AArcSl_1627 [Halalkaliarchaeum desulfuricum]
MSSQGETDDSEASESMVAQIREVEVSVNNHIDEHIQVRQSLESVLEEIQSEYANEDIDEAIRNAIREAYQDNAQSAVRRYRNLNEDVSPEQYCEDIEGLADQLSSILNEPHARKLVNDMSSWLTERGGEPLDEDERDDLVEAFKEDVSATRGYFEDLREYWSLLCDDVPDEESLLRLVRTQLKDSNRVEDVRSLTIDIRSVGNELVYPIELDTEIPPAEMLESRINEILNDRVSSWASSSDRFSEFENKVTSEWDTIRNTVEAINENAVKLDNMADDIVSEGLGSEDITSLMDRIGRDGIPECESLEALCEFIESLVSGIKLVREMARTNLDRFGHTEDSVPDRIENRVMKTTEYETQARKTREAAIAVDTVSDIEEKKGDFDTAVEEANKLLIRLEDGLKRQVETIEEIAAQFDADDEIDEARSLRDRIPSMTQLSDYITGFRDYEEIRANVLEEAREGLSDDEKKLFDHIIDKGGELTIDAGDVEEFVDGLGWSDNRLGHALTGLNNEGIINVNVSVF